MADRLEQRLEVCRVGAPIPLELGGEHRLDLGKTRRGLSEARRLVARERIDPALSPPCRRADLVERFVDPLEGEARQLGRKRAVGPHQGECAFDEGFEDVSGSVVPAEEARRREPSQEEPDELLAVLPRLDYIRRVQPDLRENLIQFEERRLHVGLHRPVVAALAREPDAIVLLDRLSHPRDIGAALGFLPTSHGTSQVTAGRQKLQNPGWDRRARYAGRDDAARDRDAAELVQAITTESHSRPPALIARWPS